MRRPLYGFEILFKVTATRVRDFAAYIVIGLFFSGACIWWAVHDIDFKWFALAFETCLVFGCAVGMSRRFWRLAAFWWCLIVLFGIHLALFATVLRQVREWRAPIVGLVFVIETGAVTTVCDAVTSRVKRRERARTKPKFSS